MMGSVSKGLLRFPIPFLVSYGKLDFSRTAHLKLFGLRIL